MKYVAFYFIAALLGTVALASAFAAQSNGPPTFVDNAAVERPDVSAGLPDFIADRQKGEDGTVEDETDGDDQEGDNEDAEREIKGIPDKSGHEAVPEDSPARTHAPPFNWTELTCVVTLQNGIQVAVPKNAGQNMLESGAATDSDGTCYDGTGPGQGAGGPPDTLPPHGADNGEGEGEGAAGPPFDLDLPPQAVGPGAPDGQE